MKLLFIAFVVLLSSFSENNIDLEVKAPPRPIRGGVAISKETITASQENSSISIDISNYSGTIYYQIENGEEVVDSGYSYISGNGQVTRDLFLLDQGLYTLYAAVKYNDMWKACMITAKNI